jgi:hypothetical protein
MTIALCKAARLLTVLLMICICFPALAQVKQKEFGGIRLGVRVDSLGIALDDYMAFYKYNQKYILLGSLDEPGHPVITIALDCRETKLKEMLGGISCGDSVDALKRRHGASMVPVCDNVRYDEKQEVFGYYNASTNHFWLIRDGRVREMGITEQIYSVPYSEGGSQVCLGPEEAARELAEYRKKTELELLAYEEKQLKRSEFSKNLLAMRQSPWALWKEIETDVYFDPKSIINYSSSARRLLVRVDYEDEVYSDIRLVEFDCQAETTQIKGFLRLNKPVQKLDVIRIELDEAEVRYIEPAGSSSRLFQTVCN